MMSVLKGEIRILGYSSRGELQLQKCLRSALLVFGLLRIQACSNHLALVMVHRALGFILRCP